MIYFHKEDVAFPAVKKRICKKWITETIKKENKFPGEINIVFCSDDYLLSVNEKYLKHNYYTDVITFNYVENNIIKGDVFISTERVKENEGRYNNKNEVYRVIIHGILHLIGYNDKTKEQENEIREKEDFYLEVLNGKFIT